MAAAKQGTHEADHPPAWYPTSFQLLTDGCEEHMEKEVEAYMHQMHEDRLESDPTPESDAAMNHTLLRFSGASVAWWFVHKALKDFRGGHTATDTDMTYINYARDVITDGWNMMIVTIIPDFNLVAAVDAVDDPRMFCSDPERWAIGQLDQYYPQLFAEEMVMD